MYRHFIGYLNITGHDMTHLILADSRNHSKDHSRNTMPNRPKTIPYLRFETLKTIRYWAETIYQSSRWICGPLSLLHVSLYIHVYCSCENMLLSKKSGGKSLILQKTCSELMKLLGKLNGKKWLTLNVLGKAQLNFGGGNNDC